MPACTLPKAYSGIIQVGIFVKSLEAFSGIK